MTDWLLAQVEEHVRQCVAERRNVGAEAVRGRPTGPRDPDIFVFSRDYSNWSDLMTIPTIEELAEVGVQSRMVQTRTQNLHPWIIYV
jgi:hypothetical protein